MDSLLADLFSAEPTARGKLQARRYSVVLGIIVINFNAITIRARRMRISRDRRVSLDRVTRPAGKKVRRNREIHVRLVHVNAVYSPCPTHQSCPDVPHVPRRWSLTEMVKRMHKEGPAQPEPSPIKKRLELMYLRHQISALPKGNWGPGPCPNNVKWISSMRESKPLENGRM